jgi:hypothetical protein
MVNLKIKGGLGNQLFQYAVARQLALKNNTEINIDYSYLTPPYGGSDTPRQYLLNLYNIKAVSNNPAGLIYKKINLLHKILRKIGLKTRFYLKKYYFENGVGFDSNILRLKDNIWLTGFFQSYKYFEDIVDILNEEFKLKTPLNTNLNITESESIFVHIRRGDYVSNSAANKFLGLCPLDYYERAVKFMRGKVKNPRFFIFSDDISWVQDYLKIEDAVYVSDGNLQDFEELALMSQCRHGVVANSSFSWWGAWLISNPTKIIIAPKQWFANDKADDSDLIPPNWLRF